MDHTKKTLIYAAVAIVLALLAWAFSEKRLTPELFQDQGEEFYPDFTDPNAATTLEVIEYDNETATAQPFKVTFENGRWTIPSHHDYPADGKDRLAKTAAGLIGIKRDEFRSDNVADFEKFGVVDPLDETGPLNGRGVRVTIKAGETVLADYIFGNPVEGRQGFRYVRIPSQSAVYASRVDVELSTNFADWIETDLLEVQKFQIRKMVLNDYSINERTRSVDQRDVITLTGKNYEWKMDKVSSGKKLDSAKVQEMLTTLDELHIVGVRPKPAGLSASLKSDLAGKQISQSDAMSLQSKGFFFSHDGNLLSNEGELQVFTNDGIRYTLRFGEVVYGTGEAVSSGLENEQKNGTGSAENRYLFVTTEFDPSLLPEPKGPGNTDFQTKPDSLWTDADRDNNQRNTQHNRWEQEIQKGRERNEHLNARFADWYYVISQESFEKLRLSRRELQVDK
ncbi:MAG TPA: DUF4340 domain-containing protein [candidate division Zixibacteria bacterium]|nr:DUF4340 domain-containing protein [candidate division Zixibacteria bacterium]